MRLDKFLKVSRIVKRRTIANELCDAKHVTVNGKVARASYNVNEGDIIELSVGQNKNKFEIVSVLEHATKESATTMYKVL